MGACVYLIRYEYVINTERSKKVFMYRQSMFAEFLYST